MTAMSWKAIDLVPGESLDGASVRFGGRNFIDDIGRHLGRRGAYLAVGALDHGGRETISRVGGALLLPVDEIARRAHHPNAPEGATRNFFGVQIHKNDLERPRRLFSPASLGRSAHHRAAWQLRPFPFCTESWQFLLDRCQTPDCETVQGWSGSDVSRCDRCMGDLTRLPAEEVAAELRPALAEAAAVLHHDPATRAAALARLPGPVAAMGSAGVLDLLVRLLPVVDPTLPRARDARIWKAQPSLIARAMAGAWNIAEGWPHAFVDHAADRCATSDHRHGDGNGGATKGFLHLAWRRGTPEPLKALVEELRASLDHRVEGRELHGRALDVATAASMVGGDPVALTRHRRMRILRTVLTCSNGYLAPKYDRVEMEGLQADLDDRLTPVRVGWLLEMPCFGVEQLVAMRLLTGFAHPYVDARYGAPQVRRSSLQRLVERIESTSRPANDSDVPLLGAIRGIGGRLKPWGPIMRDLLGRRDHAVASGDAPLLVRVRIPSSLAPALREARFDPASHPDAAFSDAMTKLDANEVLNLAPAQGMAALAAFPSLAGSHRKFMMVADVLALAKAHIGFTEMSLRSGLTPVQRLMAAAARDGLRPVGPLGYARSQGEAWLARTASAQSRPIHPSGEMATRGGCRG